MPGHKVHALERLLLSDNWVKARFSAATRITGVRQLREHGNVGSTTIYELKGKQARTVTIGKLNGATLTMELPRESEKHDFWAGSWIVQMANVYWNLPPRSAALLVQHQEILPPWTKLADITNSKISRAQAFTPETNDGLSD